MTLGHCDLGRVSIDGEAFSFFVAPHPLCALPQKVFRLRTGPHPTSQSQGKDESRCSTETEKTGVRRSWYCRTEGEDYVGSLHRRKFLQERADVSPRPGRRDAGLDGVPQKLPPAREPPVCIEMSKTCQMELNHGNWISGGRGTCTMDPVDGPYLGSQMRHVRCRVILEQPRQTARDCRMRRKSASDAGGAFLCIVRSGVNQTRGMSLQEQLVIVVK